MANVTITSSNPSITVNKSNSVVSVSSTSSTVTVSAVAAVANTSAVRSLFSVNDTGGDGSLSYASSTGIFTYTGPNQTEANARIAAAPTQVRAHLSNTSPVLYNSTTGVISIDSDAVGFSNAEANVWLTTKTTDDLAQGSSNLYFSESLARSSVSATDAGGFGSFSYNSGTGVFTYLGPGSSDIRTQLNATSPITYNTSTGTIGISAITELDSSTDVNIKAGDSIYNFIDKNDNSTTEVFKIFANGETTGASDQLFQVDEQGNVTLWGNSPDGNQARLRLRKDGDLILTQGNPLAPYHLQLNAKLAPTPAGMIRGGIPENGMWMRVAYDQLNTGDPDNYITGANSFIDFNYGSFYSSAVTGDNWDGMILGHDGGLTVAADWKGANSETAGFTVRRVRGGNVSATSGSAENLFRVRANGVVDFGQITGQTPRARMDMTGVKSVLTVDQGAFEDITMSNTGISAVAQGEIQTGSLNTTRTNGATTDIEMLRAEASVQRAVIATTDPDKRNLISLDDNSGSQANAVTIQGKSNVNIIIDDDNADTNQFTIFKTTEGSNSGNGILKLTATGNLTLANAYTFPNTDGTLNQVLTTDGNGQLSFADAGGGLTNAQVITHISQNPLTVGGNLNVQGNIIATGNIDYENVTDLYVTDQKITLNANAATDSNVQIIANRPQTTSTEIKWNEDADKWTFTNDGSTFYNLATSTSDVAEGTNLYYTDARVDAHLSGGTGITYTAGSIDLDDTAVTPKTYGDATNVPQFTVDQQGRITGVSNVAISGGGTGDLIDKANSVIRTVIAAENVASGDAVAITGGSGDNPEVSKALASDASLMPAFGIMLETITATNTGNCLLYGEHTSINMGTFPVGDEIFVSAATAGALSNVSPTGEANLIQKIGKVIKSGSGGKLTVQGAGRTNATPSLNNGNFFLGNGSNQAVTADFTDTANLAIADYTGDMLEVGNITASGKITQAETRTELIYSTGSILELGTETGTPVFFGTNVTIRPGTFNLSGSPIDSGTRLVVGDDSEAPYISSFLGHGSQSLAVGGRLAVNQSLDLGGRYLYIAADQNPGFSTYSDTNTPGNVSIQFGVGNVLTTAGNVNTFAGIRSSNRTRTGSLDYSMKMGWFDPIPAEDPDFDTGATNWIPFSDLADTKVDETFDANLTVSGNCFVTQATSLSSTLNVTGVTTLSGDTFLDGITTMSANVDLNANLDVSRNLFVDGSIRPRNTVLKQFNETKIDLGSQSGNIAALASFNAANGSIFTLTATGGIEISQIPNATTGSSYTIIVTQDGTGSHALTSTFKYQGGDKTLTTAAGNTDVISVVYDGSNYYATLSKDYY